MEKNCGALPSEVLFLPVLLLFTVCCGAHGWYNKKQLSQWFRAFPAQIAWAHLTTEIRVQVAGSFFFGMSVEKP